MKTLRIKLAVCLGLAALLLPLCAHGAEFSSETLSNTPVAVKTSAGALLGWNIINPNATPSYVHCYNAAAGSVTVGTTSQARAPIAIPANGVMFVAANGNVQAAFTTAITVAATTSPLSNVSTAPTTPLVVTLQFN
jgi:hypothetical protein